MDFENVLTVVATSPHPPLLRKQIQAVAEGLQAAGAQTADPIWLDEGIAADVFFSGSVGIEKIETALAGAAVDCILQPVQHRRKKLLIADMDSTIIHQECLDELADAAGLKAEISAITEAAMRGELDFAEALRARVGKLAGLPLSALEQTRQRLTLMEGARALVTTMRANGAACYLVSGGFRFFTRHIAEQVGFTEDRGNEFMIEDGHLTGGVVEPVLDKNSKLAALQEFAARHSLSLEETLAVGDGANDLPMLLAAGLGIAYHAKPKVNQQARARVRFSNLTALLYAQGYAGISL
jgi:phosphoserine phosphatase